jgi:hypothetical protein
LKRINITQKVKTMTSTIKKVSRILSIVACAAAMSSACNKTTNETGATAAGVRVTQLDLGRSLAGDKAIADGTSDFRPSDTIYLSVETEGTSPQSTLQARWTYQDGQVVQEQSEAIAPTGKARTEFHIVKPDGWPAGKYAVAVLLNGAAAGSKDFEVK